MLHIDIEVQTVQFYINSASQYCLMQFIDNFSATHLNSQVKCKCRDNQEIYEKSDLYSICRESQCNDKMHIVQRKLQFYEGQNLLGEANINLGFYIENNLPLIIDKITISNQFDSEAQIQVSLAWSQVDSNAKTNTQTIQYFRPASPIRPQPQPTPPPQRPMIQKKPADELHFEKRTVHATIQNGKTIKNKLKNSILKNKKNSLEKCIWKMKNLKK